VSTSALLFAAAALALPLLAYPLLRRSRALLIADVAVSLALPLLLPASFPLGRFLAGVGALVHVAKSLDLALGRVTDPAMVSSLGRYLSWHFIPPDSTFPRDPAAAAEARRQGRRRLLRALARAPVAAALLFVSERHPALHDHAFLSGAWNLAFAGAWIPAVVDLVTGLAMQSGIRFAEVFAHPALSRSPADFWGRRWNRFYRDVAYRHLFLRLRPRWAALLAVFAVSAAAHEYLVVISLGHTRGELAAFFLLHGLATLACQKLPTRLPRPLAIGLHLAWLVLTAPLAFGPVMEIFCAG
jgi:hypothetical protein